MSPRGLLRHGHGAKFGHRHGHGHGHGCGPKHGHGHGFGHHGRHGKYIGCGVGLQQSDSGHCQRHIIRGHGPKHGGIRKGRGDMHCHGNLFREILSRVVVADSEAGSPCCGTKGMRPHARPNYESEEPHDGCEEPQHGPAGHHHGHGGPHRGSGRHVHEHGRPHHGRGRYHGPGRHHHGPKGPFTGIGRPHPHGECSGCKYSQEPGSNSQDVDGQGESRPNVSNGRRTRRRELFQILQEILRDGPCSEQHNTPNTPTIPPPNTNEPITGNTESNIIEQPTETQGTF